MVAASKGDTKKAEDIEYNAGSEEWCRLTINDYAALFGELDNAIEYAGLKGHEDLFKERTVAEQFCAEKLGREGDCPKELKPGMDGYVDYQVYLINAKTKK